MLTQKKEKYMLIKKVLLVLNKEVNSLYLYFIIFL